MMRYGGSKKPQKEDRRKQRAKLREDSRERRSVSRATSARRRLSCSDDDLHGVPVKVQLIWDLVKVTKDKQESPVAWAEEEPGRRWKAALWWDERERDILVELLPDDWPVDVGNAENVIVRGRVTEIIGTARKGGALTKLGRLETGSRREVDVEGDDYDRPYHVGDSLRLVLNIIYHQPGEALLLDSDMDKGIANHIYKLDEFKDFIIQVNGEEVKVHKLILAATSDVFKAMFASGLSEAQEAKMVMEDVSTEAVKAFVEFLYGRKRIPVQPGLICELNGLADKYQVEKLKAALSRLLYKALGRGPEELRTALAVAEVSKDTKLLQRATSTLIKAVKDGTMPEGLWDELSKDLLRDVLAHAYD